MSHIRWTLPLVLLAVLAVPLTSRGQKADLGNSEKPIVADERSFSVAGRLIGLSPDGRWLASYDSEADAVCSYDTDNLTQPHACADLAQAGVYSLVVDQASWSPDGSRLAFSQDGPRYFVEADIWTFDADTGDLINLTDDGVAERDANLLGGDDEDRPFFMDFLPFWSPDGSEIAFARSSRRDGTWFGTHLMRVASDGSGQPTEVVDVTADQPMVVYFGCAWSPDGETIYYTVAKPQLDDPGNGVWSVDVASGQARHLAGMEDPDVGYPAVGAVSPRGTQVLVHYPLAEAAFDVVGPYLALLDPATGTVTPLDVQSADPQDLTSVGMATFSPDGEWLLYSSRGPEQTQIYLRSMEGGDETTLLGQDAPTIGPVFKLAWASDGTVLVQDSPNSGFLLTIEGGNVPPAFPTPSPAASPDARVTSDATGGSVDPSTVVAGTPLVVNDAVATLRSAPSPDAPIAGQLAQGATVTALGVAVEGGGYTWIPVTDDATGTIGYLRSEFLSPV